MLLPLLTIPLPTTRQLITHRRRRRKAIRQDDSNTDDADDAVKAPSAANAANEADADGDAHDAHDAAIRIRMIPNALLLQTRRTMSPTRAGTIGPDHAVESDDVDDIDDVNVGDDAESVAEVDVCRRRRRCYRRCCWCWQSSCRLGRRASMTPSASTLTA